jgi:hypothetical protein
VLFSRKDLAEYISRTFEPAWETVRPVPLVHVDFGNGNVLTRTLQGNIATYVCTADGYVVDVLPCIYDPVGYRQGLEQLSLLATVIAKQPSSPGFATLLENYHLTLLNPGWDRPVGPVTGGLGFEGGAGGMPNGGAQLGGISGSLGGGLGFGGGASGNMGGAGGMPKGGAQLGMAGGLGIGGVRGPLAGGGGKFGIEGGFSSTNEQIADMERVPPLDSAEDLANWKALRQDTRLNETVRRRQIHAMLADKGLVRPGEIMKFIYKEVLHTDLDDPYMGLGNVLFANYPFAKEDKQ